MKTLHVNFVFLLSLISVVGCSSDRIQWEKSIGGSNIDEVESLINTNDGGSIIIGSSGSNDGDVSDNHGGTDCFVVKLNSSGEVEWKKTIGGTEDETPYCIIQAKDGYVIAGDSKSDFGNISNKGMVDFWILKLNLKGNIKWQKTYGGTGADFAKSVIQTSEGGYLVVGCSNSKDGDLVENNGELDSWVLKLNNQGDKEWQKTIGGSEYDGASSVIQIKDEGYVIVGGSNSTGNSENKNHGKGDLWVVKLNLSGQIQWQKYYGGTEGDEGSCIIQSNDKGYIITGTTKSDNGNVSKNDFFQSGWVLKLDSIGNIQWEKVIGMTDATTYILAITLSSDDYEILGKSMYSNNIDYWITKLDFSGNIKNQQTFGNSKNNIESLIQAKDGGFIGAGYIDYQNLAAKKVHGIHDFWIVKFKSMDN